MREPFSLQWFDLDLDASLSFPGAYANTDFDNSGKRDSANDFVFFSLGAKVQLGEAGAAITGDFLRYRILSSTATPSLALIAGRWHALAGYGFFGNQLVVGGGLRAVSMQIAAQGGDLPNPTGTSLLTMTGVAPEVGALVKPDDLPFRIGVTARAPVTGTTFGGSQTTTDASGVTRAGTLILPHTITLPWELEGGFAIQVGPRPLNPEWINPHDQDSTVRDAIALAREQRRRSMERSIAEAPAGERAVRREELERVEAAIRAVEDQRLEAQAKKTFSQRKARFLNWPRERILVTASLLVTGPAQNAVSLEGFLNQVHDQYGQNVSYSPRLGIESEPLANLLRSRIGSYLEPSLFQGGNFRQHFTFGADLKLLPFDTFGLTKDQVWRVSVVLDVAPRYVNYGLSLGAWH